jgi:O-succinylbenzoate synthase
MINTRKEINNLDNSNKTEIYKLFEDCCEDFDIKFKKIRKLISENLLKLRLGILEQTIDKIISKFIREGLEQLKVDFVKRLYEIDLELSTRPNVKDIS